MEKFHILRHPPPLNHRHHSQHVVAPPMQGLRGHNLNFPPQGATTASYRLPTSSSRSTMNPSQNGLEIGRRQPGLVPPNGFRIYRPHQGVTPETALRHQNLPHLKFFRLIFLDQHRDMRLDIEDMSYEELLALGEQIGHDNYKKREKIGTLHCGHEYHVDLKKWLLVKNVCPICKSEALTTTGKKNV
ncbi:RING/U-box superfamily protein [Prunus dulcis]|uniref:RING-type E3 ubiquitin transferase n=1 Tax=Prunus dulcis TaxID=3755 RepID=A0A4Y1RBV4_PRUDU|nr:RING/U-box superfamily protein [Prunus dulcis]